MVNRIDVDGGWAWVVLVASFLSTAIVYGFQSNGGIYFVTFLTAFGQSRSHTAFVYAVQVMAVHVGGPVSSFVLGRFGPRATMISGSLLVSSCLTGCFFAQSIATLAVLFGFAGLGSILMYTSNMAVMSVYFVDYFCTATGLTNSGAGIGMAVTGVFIEWSIGVFGWRGSMLLLAGVVLQTTLCGALYFRPPGRISGRARIAVKDRLLLKATLRSIWRDVRWYSIVLNMTLYYFSWNIVILILKDSFLEKDLDGFSYQSAVASFGVANTMGRFTAGFLSKYLLDPPLQSFCSAVVAAGGLFAVMMATDQWTYAAGTLICSFCMGQMAVLHALLLAYIYGNEAMPILWGYGVLGGIVCLGTVPATGYLVDTSGSYSSVYILAGLSILTSGLCSVVCYMAHRRRLKSGAKVEVPALVEDGSMPMVNTKVSEKKVFKDLLLPEGPLTSAMNGESRPMLINN